MLSVHEQNSNSMIGIGLRWSRNIMGLSNCNNNRKTFGVHSSVCVSVGPHLIVPVGEGSGEPNARMCSSCCCIVGMLILRGEMWGSSGRGGRDSCSRSLCSSCCRSDMNWILMTVLGKRNTHLESRTAGQKSERRPQSRRKQKHRQG